MRIASLLPAATEWVAAIGAADLLIARTHECDAPPEVVGLPIVTSSSVQRTDTRRVDRAVRSTLERGLSLFDVDLAALNRLEPDLIITQAQCDVCAVSPSQLEKLLAEAFDVVPEIFSFDPRSLKDVLAHALRLGRRIGCLPEAMRFIASQEKQLQQIRARADLSKRTPDEVHPTVACIEWLDPLMTSGNWVPDLVSLAGGRCVCVTPGERSQVVSWDDFASADPDYIIVVPCGFSVVQSQQEVGLLSKRDGWQNLQAVRDERVIFFDGQAFFNRPGPRLYRSVDLLTSILHGTPPTVPSETWEMQRLKSASQPAG